MLAACNEFIMSLTSLTGDVTCDVHYVTSLTGDEGVTN